jgi:hypothetical protein
MLDALRCPGSDQGGALTARSLLARAAALYDAPASPLAEAAARAALRGFNSGAQWMRLALAILRAEPVGVPPSAPALSFQALGLIKYGLAGGMTLCWILLVLWVQIPLLALLAVPLFYAVEAQMVFLFPLALDGCPCPFRGARRWTRQAGGTLRVMRLVLPLAATMLSGGIVGRGFVRSWCLGCLAVCLWYEDLRLRAPSVGAAERTR